MITPPPFRSATFSRLRRRYFMLRHVSRAATPSPMMAPLYDMLRAMLL